VRYYTIKAILIIAIFVGGSILLVVPFIPLMLGLRDDEVFLGGAGTVVIGVIFIFAARGFNAWSAESGFNDWLDRYL
jgi:hypothetical protein